MTFISYAQNFEDVLLWRALKDVRQGFYIDVGAQHPDIDSVTRAFYDQGWSGINVEPVPAAAARLRGARPRDLTLELALGDADGRALLHVVDGTGLSTLDTTALRRVQDRGFAVQNVEVAVQTLANLCRRHVDGPIHFLKIDVEGSEAQVLSGADFEAFRPWIVLAEATAPLSGEKTHSAWERYLLGNDYRFAWFDGLNRFYVAAEHAERLLPAFEVPPNVDDNFVRAADTEWAARVRDAEGRATLLQERLWEGERDRRAAQQTVEQAYLLLAKEASLRALAEARAEAEAKTAAAAWRAQEHVSREAAQLAEALVAERAHAVAAHAAIDLMRASNSWKVTAPVRWVTSRAKGRPTASPVAGLAEPNEPGEPAASPVPEPPAAVAASRRPALRTVHQFHSGSATGDAVTSSLFLIRRLLRDMGYRSDIYVESRDPALVDELRLVDELPTHADYVLILHHSIGQAALDRLLALPAPKILYYHNITPPQHLPPSYQLPAKLGREQLSALSERVEAALANSEYSAVELRKVGLQAAACPLLFDLATVRQPSNRPPKAPAEPFTVLFVGRVIESKGQRELIEAFDEFNRAFAAPARLVLVGRNDGPDEPYCASMLEAIRQRRLDGQVVVTGPVSDAERNAWFRRADLYVSVSRHEGFGVPLVEAMAFGVPVLAWPAGAVATTMGGGGELLRSLAPSAVAGQMLALARDPQRRARLVARGLEAVERFALDRQVPKLVQALARAGAVSPMPDPDARANLRSLLRFSVTGHVNGTYSLSAVNGALALALEAVRPGDVRVLPVENAPTAELARIPPEDREAIASLAGRAPFETGVDVVVSQHYPVWPPPLPGDLPLSLFFWEESLVPANTVATLNRSFRGVLAPSTFVAKALVDSGVFVPVRVLPLAPRLQPFEAIGRDRAGRRRQPGQPFTFLHVSSCFPRKGVDILLAAFAAAFRAGDGVRLVIKGFPNPENTVPEQLAALRSADPGLAEIHLLNEDLPSAGLTELYAEADAVVLPTRGEGFNLPAIEAMVAGVPLIVTGFGGQRDFCGPDEARLLQFDFATSASHLASAGSVWVEPRLDDLVAALRQAVAHPDQAEERAERARERVLQDNRRHLLVNALEEVSLDLLLSAPTTGLRVAWISSWDVRCGVAEYSRYLLDEMPRDGISDLVILSDVRTPASDASAANGFRRSRPAWSLGADASVPALTQAIAQEDPDVVVIQHQPGLQSWAGLTTLLDASRRRTVLVVLHATANLLDAAEAVRAATLEALAACARVVVHTLADLNRLSALGLVSNVVLLPHGTPKPRPTPSVRTLSHDDPVVIGSYGFFLSGKGIPELIRAFAILRRRWTEARLRLVNADYGSGESAAEIARCKELARTEGVDDVVEFHTDFLPHERSLDLLRGCDALVLPYQGSQEASSAAIRSALTASVPVAVTPLPLFDEAEGAVVRLPGFEPEAIAAGVGDLLDDAAARTEIVGGARRWLEERAWPRTAARFAGLMRGLACQAP